MNCTHADLLRNVHGLVDVDLEPGKAGKAGPAAVAVTAKKRAPRPSEAAGGKVGDDATRYPTPPPELGRGVGAARGARRAGGTGRGAASGRHAERGAGLQARRGARLPRGQP